MCWWQWCGVCSWLLQQAGAGFLTVYNVCLSTASRVRICLFTYNWFCTLYQVLWPMNENCKLTIQYSWGRVWHESHYTGVMNLLTVFLHFITMSPLYTGTYSTNLYCSLLIEAVDTCPVYIATHIMSCMWCVSVCARAYTSYIPGWV